MAGVKAATLIATPAAIAAASLTAYFIDYLPFGRHGAAPLPYLPDARPAAPKRGGRADLPIRLTISYITR
jgi:hypothetical protein